MPQQVCPDCHRPVDVKPGAKEGRCRPHRPKRKRRVVRREPKFENYDEIERGGWRGAKAPRS